MSVTRQQFQGHAFHMVDISPWPLVTSFALLALTTSAVGYFHGVELGGYAVLTSIISVVGAIILWFRDVAAEGSLGGHHSFAVQRSLNYGVLLFIVSEIFFFVSIFWAFFHSALSPTVELGNQWPPAGIETLNAFEVPLLNTLILLSSGASLTYAHHALIQGNRKATIIGFIVTLILAVSFTGYQALEYYEAPFTISDGIYGSTFYMGTGFHGAHVIIGTLFLLVAFFRILNYSLTDHHHLGFESAALYWHFVDVVWLFLWVSIYWWGGLSVAPLLFSSKPNINRVRPSMQETIHFLHYHLNYLWHPDSK